MVQFMLKMLFTFGFVWAFGFLYISTQFVWAAYVFSILNSLQGLSIFIFICVRSEIIRDASRRWLSEQGWLPQSMQDKLISISTSKLSQVISP